MSKKLSLLFAAAVLAFTFQTAMAQDEDDFDDDDIVVEQFDDDDDAPDFGPRGPGMRHGMGMRHGGHGPAMRGPGKHRMGMMGMRHGMFGMRMMERLDLTAEQKKQLVDVMTENFRERFLGRIEMDEAFKKLRALHESDNPDHDAIVAANAAVGEMHGKMDVLDRKFRDKLDAVLTPEQREKMKDFRKDWDGPRRFRDGKGPRDGKPFPPHMQRGPGPMQKR